MRGALLCIPLSSGAWWAWLGSGQCPLRSLLASLLASELATDSVSLVSLRVWPAGVVSPPPRELFQLSLRSRLTSASIAELATDSVSLWICTTVGLGPCLAFTFLCQSLPMQSLVQNPRLLLLQLVWHDVHLYTVLRL